MTLRRLFAVAATWLALLPLGARADYLVNGSFDGNLPGTTTPGDLCIAFAGTSSHPAYYTCPSLTGWTLDTAYSGSAKVQVTVAGTYGGVTYSTYDGSRYYLETDSTAPYGIYQDVATTVGSVYTVTWRAAAHPANNDGHWNELWIGQGATSTAAGTNLARAQVVDIKNSGASGLLSTDWQTFNYTFYAYSTTTRVEFRGYGTVGKDGDLIDGASMNLTGGVGVASVPVSATAGLWGAAAAALVLARRAAVRRARRARARYFPSIFFAISV